MRSTAWSTVRSEVSRVSSASVGHLVGIRDAGELGDHAGPGLGVEALAVTRLAHLQRRRDVHEHEAAGLGDHGPDVAADLVVGRDGRAHGDAAGPGDLGGDEADAADVEVAVVAREAELGRQVQAHAIAVEQGHAAPAVLAQPGGQGLGDGRLARPREAGHEDGQAARWPGRGAAAQLGLDLGKRETGRQVLACGRAGRRSSTSARLARSSGLGGVDDRWRRGCAARARPASSWRRPPRSAQRGDAPTSSDGGRWAATASQQRTSV